MSPFTRWEQGVTGNTLRDFTDRLAHIVLANGRVHLGQGEARLEFAKIEVDF